ncbi:MULTISPECIES: hypothetical protein [unclassified Streptomyces]|uniref:hypothetical protein n=1 Tax=unclassified Streptomyces TaxID=2593676 RepID=UPI002DD9AA40|nr:hypothetical protein [Streptomyces sp. NBC_01750]WSB04388.1 hypothetical protein OIE54_37140 [Streptomyces sp. NBC_01794]WSD31330.1 hypothetical protein OG966_04965 [Streptomyces sp. NBC_01750]
MAVIDDGRKASLAAGMPGRRPMFTSIEGSKMTWPDGTVEGVVLATGYQPARPRLPRPPWTRSTSGGIRATTTGPR